MPDWQLFHLLPGSKASGLEAKADQIGQGTRGFDLFVGCFTHSGRVGEQCRNVIRGVLPSEF